MNKKALKWIFKNTKFCFLPVCVLTLVNILFAAFSLVMAYITGEIIDSAVNKELNRVIYFSVILVCVALVSLLLRLIFRNMDERVRVKAEFKLKKSFLEKVITRNFSEITKYHSGDLQSRMFSDVYVVTNGVMTLIPNLADLLTTVIGAFVMLTVVDLSFAVLFLIAGLAVLFCSLLFRNKIKNLHKDVQKKDSRVRSFIQEVFINLLAVKVFNSKGGIQKKNDQLLDEYKKSRLRRTSFMILMTSLVAFIFEAGFVYALIWGAFGIYKDAVTYGTLARVLQLTGKIQSPLASFSFLTSQLFQMIGSAERLMEIENLSDEGNKAPCSNLYDKLNSIEFKNVTFAYEDEIVIDNASFVIDKNTFTAITGASGTGKSTILKLMLGVYKPQNGEILLNTENGKLDITNGVGGLFAYVPQGNLIFSGTIRENITFISDNADTDEINRAVKLACVNEFTDNLPDGLDSVIGENGIGLSEGQIQRIAIARAILSGNKILLLDEATSALDEETEKKVLENLNGITDITCVAVTHKNAALEISSKHIKIEGNKAYEEKCVN
ncbi:MAG: ABC transporter ATP-binding protein [Clostridia bacterium]|nr:ABC transporter ATP-binding protein [Clostridia bacterium]